MKQLSIYRNEEKEIVLERENEFGHTSKRFFDSEKGLLEALKFYISSGEIDKYELSVSKEFWSLVIKHLEKEGTA